MKRNVLIDRFKHYVPGGMRKLIRRNFSMLDYNIHYQKSRNPFLSEPDEFLFENSDYKIGIFKEFYQYHKSYIAACRDLKISYNLLELFATNWQQQVIDSGCDAFLIWPSTGTTVWKALVDDRVRLLSEDLEKIVFPSVKEIWLFESKNRVQDWLRIHEIPQPETWLFYDLEEALEFCKSCSLPIIYKTNLGATATGVIVFRNRKELFNFVKKAFNHGIVPQRHHPLDRQWGCVFLQEFLENVEEWRMIRVGESYFGYRKEKVGDFHSGSHKWSWLDPGNDLLNFIKRITETGGFTSMDIDVFKDREGNLYVNELHTVFGASTPKEMLMINGIEGRYRFIDYNWVFEPGSFSKNECSNLRVEHLLKLIKQKRNYKI